MSKPIRGTKLGIARYLKEDEKGLFVVDNYGNVQRPDPVDRPYPGYKLCTAKKGDKLYFKFSHCRWVSQGFASDGSHWSTR